MKHKIQIPFAKTLATSTDVQGDCSKKKEEIPRRRKPVVQWQGHRAPALQAERRGQGRQKLDNQ